MKHYTIKRLVKIIIAIEGVDGSGKSTQSMMIYKYLINKQIKAEYIRPVFYILNFFKKENMGKCSPRMLRTDSKSSVNFIIKICGFSFAVITYILLKIKGRKTILVCDRFFYQFFFDLFGSSAKNIVSFFPKPDLTFYLDLGPNKIYNRLSGSDINISREYYENVISYYQNISDSYGFIRIDASDDQYKIQNKIVSYLINSQKGTYYAK